MGANESGYGTEWKPEDSLEDLSQYIFPRRAVRLISDLAIDLHETGIGVHTGDSFKNCSHNLCDRASWATMKVETTIIDSRLHNLLMESDDDD